MNYALIALSKEGACLAAQAARSLPGADLFVHEHASFPPRRAPVGGSECSASFQPAVSPTSSRQGTAGLGRPGMQRTACGLEARDTADSKSALQPAACTRMRRFRSIIALTRSVFRKYRGLVYFAPCGVALRALAPLVKHKLTDPAVVVVDAGGRYAISLLSGHEGGANELALRVANILGAEPVVTTTTEALKTAIVGVGCRRGVSGRRIVRAVRGALRAARVKLPEVRLLASADIKAGEAGLLEASRLLSLPLRFISSEELRSTAKSFQRSELVQRKVALPAVAEPAALLAGRRTRLVLPKKTFRGVTVAIARESCLWSASAPAANSTAPAVLRKP